MLLLKYNFVKVYTHRLATIRQLVNKTSNANCIHIYTVCSLMTDNQIKTRLPMKHVE